MYKWWRCSIVASKWNRVPANKKLKIKTFSIPKYLLIFPEYQNIIAPAILESTLLVPISAVLQPASWYRTSAKTNEMCWKEQFRRNNQVIQYGIRMHCRQKLNDLISSLNTHTHTHSYIYNIYTTFELTRKGIGHTSRCSLYKNSHEK